MNKLIRWYQEHCDGDWEHHSGFQIETLDNPGFSIFIDLDDTDINVSDRILLDEMSADEDWAFVQIKDGKFDGACSLNNFDKLIDIFFDKVVLEAK